LEQEIPLSLIDDNPFNPRKQYEPEEIRGLADSLRSNGLLTTLAGRQVGKRYQIVYGHRRLRAARSAGLKTVKVSIRPYSDKEMLTFSLVENLERRDLSDYEKGISFAKMNEEFGYSYAEIARIVGLSRQHVFNIAKMTELFDKAAVSKDPTILQDMFKISEHHARLLSGIADLETRRNTMKFVISNGMSVRDLQRMIYKLRSWFTPASEEGRTPTENLHAGPEIEVEGFGAARYLETIKANLHEQSESPDESDFNTFDSTRLHGRISPVNTDLPLYERADNTAARRKDSDWFHKIAPNYFAVLRDIQVKRFSDVALATLFVIYKNKAQKSDGLILTARGTVVMLRERDHWRILHEQWSPNWTAPKDHEIGSPA
jgi:ParB/RepB/Spo0J family partition protein